MGVIVLTRPLPIPGLPLPSLVPAARFGALRASSPPTLLTADCCWAGFVFDPVSLAGKWQAVCRASQNSPRLPAKDRGARLCVMGWDQLKDDSVPHTLSPASLLSPYFSPALHVPRPPTSALGLQGAAWDKFGVTQAQDQRVSFSPSS